MHHVNPEVYEIINQRWLRNRNHPKICDIHLKNFIQRFNTVDGLKTVWSCSGHTREEQGRPSPDDISKFITRSYIAFAMTEGNEEILQGLSNWLVSEEVRRCKETIRLSIKWDWLNLGGLTRDQPHKNIVYPIFSLEIRYNPYKDLDRTNYKAFLNGLFDFI